MSIFKTKQVRDRIRENDGYNLAANEICQGMDIEKMKNNLETAYHFGDYDSFDKGYDRAIREHEGK